MGGKRMTETATQTKQLVIFCDFDGTITVNDNIIAIMKHFQPPGWEELAQGVLDKRISVRKGVGAMFKLLPTSRKAEIVDFAIRNATIRDGFEAFVRYCAASDIKLLVTSGGIDFFIYPLLAPFGIPEANIYCNASSFEGDTIDILWPHPCDDECDVDCGMCKTTIIRRYPKAGYKRILIGDSVTDFAGAKLVDEVFARSTLIDLCQDLKLNYKPFQTFHDIIDQLEAQPVL